MLEALFGNQNVQKVLLFLFLNGKCYGTQLQRLLKTPLTPLQNALNRLEKGKILTSYNEGKTKLYQLNLAFPLINEIEQLLKKTYTLLSPKDKKLFSLVQQDTLEKRIQIPLLYAFWERLKQVKQFKKHKISRSGTENIWEGKGTGIVSITNQNDTALIFAEKGSWHLNNGQEVDFSNIFRWTIDREAGMISLEHLRYGEQNPVFLFHLVPTGNNMLASVESHLCQEDAYMAQIPWDNATIRLNWRVIGPKKNDELEYIYT